MSSRNMASVLALVASGSLACAGCAAQSEDPAGEGAQVPGEEQVAAPSGDNDPQAASQENSGQPDEHTGKAKQAWWGGWGGWGGGWGGWGGGWGGWGGLGGWGGWGGWGWGW
jgi:hypothetical protein